MGKKILTEKPQKEKKVLEVTKEVTKEEGVLVTFSGSVLGRFQAENNQALVNLSELKENEKFTVVNGKTYIQVTEPGYIYLL